MDKNIPMRVVKEKTGLTSRQIRYYDQVNLIFPERSSGNQRLFSEGDIDRLLKIKELIDQGYNIDSIKKKLNPPEPIKKAKKGDGVKKKNVNKNRYEVNKLKSLYPVSNRSHLTKVLEKKDRNK